MPRDGENTGDPPASRFYSGLIAELYEPLAGGLATPEDHAAFLDEAGTPALELCCGTGKPLLDLLERGYEVEGLDASPDMLALCRERARERGLAPVLHEAEMQRFDLPSRYPAIFVAGPSFTLLTNDSDAHDALACIHAHLEPGGSARIPLEVEGAAQLSPLLGRHRETTAPDGARLRVGFVSLDEREGGRQLTLRLRYERTPASGEPEVVERDWERRYWSQSQFRDLARSAGFGSIGFEPGATATGFVARLERAG